MKRSESIKEIAAALAAAQSDIGVASKSATNPYFKSNYADISMLLDVCREPLSKNGIAVIQGANTSIDEAGVCHVHITTLLSHKSGDWIENTLTLIPKDSTPQAVGSAITYGRRYELQAMVCIPAADDDGQGAQAPKGEAPKPAATKPDIPKPLYFTDEKASQAIYDANDLAELTLVWSQLTGPQKRLFAQTKDAKKVELEDKNTQETVDAFEK